MQWPDRRVRRVKLRDLYILRAVAEHGSMAKAAEHLAISHPVISKAISELEHALGVRLLDRSSRGVEPTTYGDALLRCGIAVFDDVLQGLNHIDFLAKAGSGELRVGCPEAMAAGLLPVIAEQFSKQYPNARLHVAYADTASAQFDQLRERRVDMLLGTMPRPFAEEDLVAEHLFDEKIVVVAGVHSGWARRRRLTFADLLQDEHWVLAPTDSVPGRIRAEVFAAARLPLPSGSIFSLSIHLSVALVASGRFIALMPRSVARFHPGRGALKILPVVNLPRFRVAVGIITVKNRTISPLAEHFIACACKAADLLAKDT
jgi:DNA-binding transcriptional LysR family regulator